MNKTRHIWLSLSLLMIAALACNALSALSPDDAAAPETLPVPTGELPEPLSTSSGETPPEVPIPTPPADVYAPGFAEYQLASVRLPEAFHGYDLPLDLGSVGNLDAFELSAPQLELLAQNGFVVTEPIPGQYREFYQIYESGRYSQQPMFITVDSVLHVYHLLFDKLLRDLETQRFIPILESLTAAMLQTSQSQVDALQGSDLEEPARRNLAFYAVAARLLGMQVPTPDAVADLVDQEVALIEAHEGPAISPIWDRPDLPQDERLIEDYSQYIPRGHYTRSETLKRYFKTMMWFGRMTYRLQDAFETQRALLITHALRTTNAADGTPATELWQNIYEPTTFLVGKADDLSYFEYAGLSDSVFGSNPQLSDFGDPTLMDNFMLAAETLPPPQINSMWVWIWQDEEQATKGFRMMGQRFTIDAYVFEQMIWREVGTLENPRGLPKALDFFAALGSEEALNLLREMGEDEYLNFDTQMQEVRTQLGALGEDTWTENVYWSWLYALHPVIEPKDERFPEFMRTQAWLHKDLQTALGSYTELKHDTILYAKQVMAELGGGPMELPKGYVEPNPEAYARLYALAQMTRDGLANRDLLEQEMRANLENLMDLLAFLQDMAERELQGEPISEEEYGRIRFYGGEIENLTLASADCGEEGPACRELEDQQAALIADIATGPSDQGEGLWALEEAIGQPTLIFVVLPDPPLRVGVGAVFTYYEFPVPVAERMTDEEWQALVAEGTQPPQPAWTESFIAP